MPLSILYAGAIALLAALFVYGPTPWASVALRAAGIFWLPSVLAGAATAPVAAALGGRFNLRRGLLLADLALLAELPFYLVWFAASHLAPAGSLPSAAWVVALAQGPVLWGRQMSLYGVSNPSHARSLPVALLQPIATLLGLSILAPPGPVLLLGAALILAIAFGCSLLLLRAADHPLRREFGTSGVALIRPLMDHVASRDPQATAQLEAFFGRRAIEADLRATVVSFGSGDRTVATVALPTVHPGPFAAVGASDLPRKIDRALGPDAGTVFVPHTPCTHDLDLPSQKELDRVSSALDELRRRLPGPSSDRASPLLSPRPGSLARAQVLGDAVLVVMTQAPEPSDDIDYAIVDPLYGREFGGARPVIAFIDAHNSYLNDTGDLTYGSPKHRELVEDILAAVDGALAAARPGTIRIGTAVRSGFSVGGDGIGPEGIRALVVEAAGTTTAYVLIDGNNLLSGLRGMLLDRLSGLVDAAEVMTTDNHLVHEVDGGVNAVGERLPAARLAAEVDAAVREALGGLVEVRVRAGSTEVPAVRVLGPGWTARLLTSLGDTVSVFANAALTTFLLLVASSLVVVALLR